MSKTNAAARELPRTNNGTTTGHVEPTLRRARRAGVSLDKAFSRHTGTALGLAKLRGQITTRQAEAGADYAKVRRTYLAATGTPMSARCSLGNLQPCGSIAASPVGASGSRHERRWHNVAREIAALPRAVPLLDRLCLDDDAPAARDLPVIREALDRLAAHFGAPLDNTLALADPSTTRLPDDTFIPDPELDARHRAIAADLERERKAEREAQSATGLDKIMGKAGTDRRRIGSRGTARGARAARPAGAARGRVYVAA